MYLCIYVCATHSCLVPPPCPEVRWAGSMRTGVMSHHVGVGTHTRVLCKSHKQVPSHHSSPSNSFSLTPVPMAVSGFPKSTAHLLALLRTSIRSWKHQFPTPLALISCFTSEARESLLLYTVCSFYLFHSEFYHGKPWSCQPILSLGKIFLNFSQGTCSECGSSAYSWDMVSQDRGSSGSQD